MFSYVYSWFVSVVYFRIKQTHAYKISKISNDSVYVYILVKLCHKSVISNNLVMFSVDGLSGQNSASLY